MFIPSHHVDTGRFVWCNHHFEDLKIPALEWFHIKLKCGTRSQTNWLIQVRAISENVLLPHLCIMHWNLNAMLSIRRHSPWVWVLINPTVPLRFEPQLNHGRFTSPCIPKELDWIAWKLFDALKCSFSYSCLALRDTFSYSNLEEILESLRLKTRYSDGTMTLTNEFGVIGEHY